jgi:tetratricopeptide (TPR) repeat protein
LTPLVFIPWTIDAFETNKQTVLVVLTGVATMTHVVRVWKQGSMGRPETWLSWLPLAFLAAVTWSAAWSPGGYVSWIGNASQEYTSVLTLAGSIGLLALLWRAAKTNERFLPRALFFLTTSAILAGLMGVASVFGWLPALTDSERPWNTVGTFHALAILLVCMTSLAHSAFVFPYRLEPMAHWFPASALTIITLILLHALHDGLLFMIGLGGLAMVLVFGFLRAKEIKDPSRVFLPLSVMALSVFLWFAPIPWTRETPGEVTLNMDTSVDIATRVMSRAPGFLFGSGPGTYAFAYTKYRPREINDTPYWQVRFDRAANALLTTLPTLGVMASWLLTLLVLGVCWRGGRAVWNAHEGWERAAVLLASLIPLIAAACVYVSNMTLTVLFFSLLGLLVGSIKPLTRKTTRRLDIGRATSVTLAGFFIGVLTIVFVAIQRQTAEIVFAQAALWSRKEETIQRTIGAIERAAFLNRFNDMLYRNMAQALLSQMEHEWENAATALPQKEDAERRNALMDASVRAARRATERGPANVMNWQMLGTVLQYLSGEMKGAGEQAAEAYQRAIKLEPNNPRHHTELAKTYLAAAARSDVWAWRTGNAEMGVEPMPADFLLAAEASLRHAIDLKTDDAQAHFQLALVLEQQGRQDDAIGKMESVARHNPLDVGVAFRLGVLYLRRGVGDDLARAQNAFEYAVSIAPFYSDARWFLASVYERQGNTVSAIEQLERVRELNPEHQLVHIRLDRLRAGLTASEPTQPLF